MTPIFEHVNAGPILIVQAADALTAAALGLLEARTAISGRKGRHGLEIRSSASQGRTITKCTGKRQHAPLLKS
jgi:hypothetical protein